MDDTAKNPENQQPSTIPPPIAEHLRTLLHDLSNALEIVVQAEYLLSTVVEMPEASKEWLGLLHKGTQQAIQLNQKLREYVHKQGEDLVR